MPRTRAGKVHEELYNQALNELEEDGIITRNAFDREIGKGPDFNSAVDRPKLGEQTPRALQLKTGDKFGVKDPQADANLPQASTTSSVSDGPEPSSTPNPSTGDRPEGHEWYRQTEGEEVRKTVVLTEQERKELVTLYSPLSKRPRLLNVNLTFVARNNERVIESVVAEGVSNQADVVRVLQARWGQTEEEATLFAKYVDAWATGWALTVTRLEGVNVTKKLMSLMTPEEKTNYQARTRLSEATTNVEEFLKSDIQADIAAIIDKKTVKIGSKNYSIPESEIQKYTATSLKQVATDLVNQAYREQIMTKDVMSQVVRTGKFEYKGKTNSITVEKTYNDFDRWQKDFREITIFHNSKANKQLIAELKQVYYEQHLGSFAKVSHAAARLKNGAHETAFVTSSAFALSGNINIMTGRIAYAEQGSPLHIQLHELHHLLMASLPKAIYHEILRHRFPSLDMQQLYRAENTGTISASTGHILTKSLISYEEQVVQELTRAVMFSDLNAFPFTWKYSDRGYEAHVANAVVELGRVIKVQHELILSGNKPTDKIATTDDAGNAVTTPYGKASYTGRGSSNPVELIRQGGMIETEWGPGLLVRWIDRAVDPHKWVQGKILKVNYVKDMGKIDLVASYVKVATDKYGKEKTIKFVDMLNPTNIIAHQNDYVLTGVDTSKMPNNAKYVLQNFYTWESESGVDKETGSAVASLLGHYQKFVNEQISDIDISAQSTLTNESPQDTWMVTGRQSSPGYRWFSNIGVRRTELLNSGINMSEKRIARRMQDSFLGWLDIGGYSSWMQSLGLNTFFTKDPKSIPTFKTSAENGAALRAMMDKYAADEAAFYASKVKVNDEDTSKDLIKVEDDVEKTDDDEFDFNVMDTPQVSDYPVGEYKFDIEEDDTTFGKESDRLYVTTDGLLQKFSTPETRDIASAIIGGLLEKGILSPVTKGTGVNARYVGYFVKQRLNYRDVYDAIEKTIKDPSVLGEGVDRWVEALQNMTVEHKNTIPSHIADILTEPDDLKRNFANQELTGEQKRANEVARKEINDLTQTLHDAAINEVQKIIDGQVDFDWVNARLTAKTQLLNEKRPAIIEQLQSVLGEDYDTKQVEQLVDQAIDVRLKQHLSTAEEMQEMSDKRTAELEQQSIETKLERSENWTDSEKFFDQQVQYVLKEVGKGKSKAYSDQSLWERLTTNNIFGFYLNKWVLGKYRLAVPQAMHLRYPLLRNARAMEYFAGVSNIRRQRGQLAKSFDEIVAWDTTESEIPRVTNRQLHLALQHRQALRKLIKNNLFTSEYAKVAESQSRSSKLLNDKFDLIVDEWNKLLRDANYNAQSALSTMYDKYKSSELNTWLQTHNDYYNEFNILDVYKEQEKTPLLRRGFKHVDVEYYSFDRETLNPTTRKLTVSNIGTFNDAQNTIRQQQSLVDSTIEVWNPMKAKSTEFQREFTQVIKEAVNRSVRGFVLNTRTQQVGRNTFYIVDSFKNDFGLMHSKPLTLDEYKHTLINLMKATAKSATTEFFQTIDGSVTKGVDIAAVVKRVHNDLDNDIAWKELGLSTSEYQNEAVRRSAIYALAKGTLRRGAFSNDVQVVINDALKASSDAGNKPGSEWKPVTVNGVTYKTAQEFNNALDALESTGHAYVDVVDAIKNAIRLKETYAKTVEENKEITPNGSENPGNALPDLDSYGFTDLTVNQLKELLQYAEAAERSTSGFDMFRQFINRTAYTRSVPGLLFRSNMYENQSAYQPTVWNTGTRNTLKMLGIESADVDKQVKTYTNLLLQSARRSAIARTVSSDISKDDETFQLEPGFTFDYIDKLNERKRELVEYFNLYTRINKNNVVTLTTEFQSDYLKKLVGRPWVKHPETQETVTFENTLSTINELSAGVLDLQLAVKMEKGAEEKQQLQHQLDSAIDKLQQFNELHAKALQRYITTNKPLFNQIGFKIATVMDAIDGALPEGLQKITDNMSGKSINERNEIIGQYTELLLEVATNIRQLTALPIDAIDDITSLFTSKMMRSGSERDLIAIRAFSGYAEIKVLRESVSLAAENTGMLLRDAVDQVLDNAGTRMSSEDLLNGLAMVSTRAELIKLQSEGTSITDTLWLKTFNKMHDSWSTKLLGNKEQTAITVDQYVNDRDMRMLLNNEASTTEYLVNKIYDTHLEKADYAPEISMEYQRVIKTATPLENLALEYKRQHMLNDAFDKITLLNDSMMSATQRGATEVGNAIKSALNKQNIIEASALRRHLLSRRYDLMENPNYKRVMWAVKQVLQDVDSMERAYAFLSNESTKKSVVLKDDAQLENHGDYVSFIVPESLFGNAGNVTSELLKLKGKRVLVPASWYSSKTGTITFKSAHGFIPQHLSELEKRAFVLTRWFVENDQNEGYPVGQVFVENFRQNIFEDNIMREIEYTRADIADYKRAILDYTNDVLNSMVMRMPLKNELLRYTNTGSVTIKEPIDSKLSGQLGDLVKGANSIIDINMFRNSQGGINFAQLTTRLKTEGLTFTYLSNENLMALTPVGMSSINRYKLYRELVDARDKHIIDPLKKRIEASQRVLNTMSLTELNTELAESGWSHTDRAAFYADYWHVTQSRQGNLIRDYVVATGKFPDKESVAELVKAVMQGKSQDVIDGAIKEQQKNYDALLNLIATNGYETAIKKSSITQAEVRFNNESEQNYTLTGIIQSVKPQLLNAEQQIVRQTLLSQTELMTGVENSVVSDLLTLLGDKKTDAVDLMRLLLNDPERLNIQDITDAFSTGLQPAGARNIKRIKLLGDQDVENDVTATRRMRTHIEAVATRDLQNVGEQFKDNPSLVHLYQNMPQLAVSAGRGRINLGDLITSFQRMKTTETMSKEQQAFVSDVQSKVLSYVKSQAKVLIGARLELFRSMNDPQFLAYTYEQDGSNVRVIEDGVEKYVINYKTGEISSAVNENVRSIGNEVKLTDYDVVTTVVDESFVEQMQSLSLAQVKLVDLLARIARGNNDMFIGGSKETHADALKTIIEAARANKAPVPAVYWHGIANMQRPEGYKAHEAIYVEPAMSPTEVEMEYGSHDESTLNLFVDPVVKKWLSSPTVQRVTFNENNEVGADSIGYAVYTQDGKRSLMYRNLVQSGLSRNKALEVYALTEHPEFKSWMAGDLLENLELQSPGNLISNGFQIDASKYKALRVMNAMKLRNLMNSLSNQYNENQYMRAKKLYGETLGAHLSDAQLDKAFDKYTENGKDVVPLMMEVSKFIDAMNTTDIGSITQQYEAHLAGEQQLKTGDQFTTLAFEPSVDSELYDSAKGIQVHDLVPGLHIRKQRTHGARFIKMENPLVIDAGNMGMSMQFRNEAIKMASKGKHDGVVFVNVVQDALNPQTTAIAYTFKDANVRVASNMFGQYEDSVEVASAPTLDEYTSREPVVPDFDKWMSGGAPEVASSPVLYQGTENAPPLNVSAGVLKISKPIGRRAVEFADQLEREWQGITRLSLAMDMAYPFIQGGKFSYGIFTGRPQDSLIWLNALRGAARGMAPRIAITGKGGEQMGMHAGRREYIKVFLELRKDPYYEVMKDLGVPLNFFNYERAIHKARSREYQEKRGNQTWADTYVDLMTISEVGHVQQDMVRDAMVNKLPVAGMAERFTSLNHDLLMFNLIKWQLKNNPLLSPTPLNKLKYERGAKETANFIALSLGDFQYSTNEDIDMKVGRIAKWISVAPRWQLANWLMKPHWNYLAKNIPFLRSQLGGNNRVFNAITSYKDNPELAKYQYKTIYGSMLFVAAAQAAIQLVGQFILKRDDWKSSFPKIGAMRVGDWTYADSSGVWDDYNKLYTIMQAANKMIKHDDNSINSGDETLDWLTNTSNKLGYNASPAVMKVFELFKGTDVINRSSFETDRDWNLFVRNKIKPAVSIAPDNFTVSNYVSSMLPTGANEYVDTTVKAQYVGRTESQRAVTEAIGLTSAVFGWRLKFDPWVEKQSIQVERIRKQHEKNWQYSPNVIDLIKQKDPTAVIQGWNRN